MTPLERFLEEEIARGSFPGGAAIVGSADAIVAQAAAGRAAVEPEPAALDANTRFDLASLTKPLAAGALARIALARGLGLGDAPGRFLPEWKRTRFEGITVESLLTHTSGLPAWFPLYARGEGPAAYRRTLAGFEPDRRPGSGVLYSDIGFLVIGEILEFFFSSSLDRLFAELVAKPTGSAAHFLPSAAEPCAATERGDRFERRQTAALGLSYAAFRDGVVRGEVHDGNAFRRGGVAAHAGLFAAAEDVWKLGRAWLEPSAAAFAADRTPDFEEGRGLAWQGPRGAGSSIGEFSAKAYGHTGFTGTSLWVDPEPGAIYVLLTNRIHPDVQELNFNEVRQRFHRVARRLL